jgi:hypothetical protein
MGEMISALLIAAVVLALAARRIFVYPVPAGEYGALRRHEVAFVASAADAMYPPGGAIVSSGRDANLTDYADRFVAASHPRTRLLLHVLFTFVEHATLLFPAPGWGGWRRFSSLSHEQQVAVLDGWSESSLFPRRLVFTSLRAVLTMGYFAHPGLLRELSLAPFAIDTPVCEADLIFPRIGEHPDTITHRRESLGRTGPPVPLAIDGPLHPDYTGDAPPEGRI